MSIWWLLTRRELATQLFSLRGYVIIAGVQFLLGLGLMVVIDALNNRPFDMPITEKFPQMEFFWLVLLLVSPLITMRSFAQERNTGTLETLLTTPVRDWQVVMAKFVGALLFFMITWLPIVGYPLVLRQYSADWAGLSWGSMFSTFLGISMLGMLFMSMGCFASSITRSQIVAAMTSAGLGVGLFLVGYFAWNEQPQPGWSSALLRQISLMDHMRDFAGGIVDTRHVIFYVSASGMFLYLTQKVLGTRHWR